MPPQFPETPATAPEYPASKPADTAGNTFTSAVVQDRPESQAGSATVLPEDRYDLAILQSLRRIIRAVDLYSKRLKGRHAITAPQLICLLAIVESGSVGTGALAQRVYLSNSTVVGILDRLEERGLIQRQRDARDRRQVHVSATQAGHLLATSAPSPVQDRLADALKHLPHDQQLAISSDLQTLVHLMEVGHLDASPILDTGAISEDTTNPQQFITPKENE